MTASLAGGSLRKHERELIDQLLADKRLTHSELTIALAEQQRLGGLLHSHLSRLGLISPADLRDIRAAQLQLPIVDFSAERPDINALALLPSGLARHHQILPLKRVGDHTLLLALADPHDLIGIDQVTAHLRSQGLLHINLALASDVELHREIDRYFGERQTVESLIVSSGSEASVEKIVSAVLQQAYDLEASDIHFEPDQYFLRIRLRLDGVLKQTHLLHASLWPGIAVKLKVLAGMDIAESRLPQDGRFNTQFGMNDIDFRAACLPSRHGENIVLRLLDKNKNIVPLHRIDLSAHARACIHQAMSRPEGVVLVTGPTGSGKTTTLYSVLSALSTEAVNIMTLEDPIEYPLPLIRQTQISEKLNFADGVRALMRQDPDIILVGEIRDQETAEMTFRAAMTGHQVFATLHTNSALAAVQRLSDMGVSTDILYGNIIAVIGQRLVRRLCPACKRTTTPDEQAKQALRITSEQANTPLIYQAIGCQKCHQTGYLGRLVLMEVLLFDEMLDELVSTKASPLTLMRHAQSTGFVSLREEAIRRVLAGDTTLEEARRSVNLFDRSA